jgi:hypothetical protein
MAVVALKSTAVTNANALPRVQNSRGLADGEVVRAVNAMSTITSGDSVGSTYRVGKIKSSDFMDRIRVTTTADMGTTTAADLGLYDLLTHPNGGTVVDVDFFASAVSFNGGAIDSDITDEAAAAGGLIANGEKRVWEMLGLSSDPGKEYDVAWTLTGACDGTGSVRTRVYVVR